MKPLKEKKFEIVLVVVALIITTMMYVFVHKHHECDEHGCKAHTQQ